MVLKVPVTSKDHIQGYKDAPITLLEYGDYECLHCAKVYPMIKQLQKHYGKQLRLIFRNFPLNEIHPYAEMAAEATEFADTFKRFWEMHDLIYENQEHLSYPFLLELAETLNLPVDELEDSLENREFEEKIHLDYMGGVRSGVNGTPTFFINDHFYNGSHEYESLVSAIDSILYHYHS